MEISARASIALLVMTLTWSAKAADFGPDPVLMDTWTGFSVGAGGGVAFMDADVNASASRTDEVGECLTTIPTPPGGVAIPPDFFGAPCVPSQTFTLLDVSQSNKFNISDLSDTGGFFTVQAAYDYQFTPRWVVGAFVDADWSNLEAHARQTRSQNSGSLTVAQDNLFGFAVGDQETIIDTKLSTDWSISVGGRIGWLANPRTLLYFLAAYTHQDMSDARIRVSIADPIQFFGTSPFGQFDNTPADLLIKLPDSLDGFSLGGGGEVKLGGPWALKMEYRWTHLDGGSGRVSSSRFQSVPVGTGITCGAQTCTLQFSDFINTKSQASAAYDLDLHTVRALLTYHFWSGGYGG